MTAQTWLESRSRLGRALPAVFALLLAFAAAALVITKTTAAAALFLLVVAIVAAATPQSALIAVIVLFALHPLAMRVAAVDLGLTGGPLLLLSAWKEVALGAILVVAAAPFATRRRVDLSTLRARLHPFDLLALAFVVLVVGTLAAQHNVAALNAARLVLFPVGAYVAIRMGVLRGWADLSILIVAGGAVALAGILQAWLLDWRFVQAYWATADEPIPFTFYAQYLDGPRSSGTLSSPVEYGTYLAMIVTIAVATALVRVDRRRFALAAVPVLVIALAFSFSRSSILAALLGCAALLGVTWFRSLATSRVLALTVLLFVPAVALSGLVYANRGGFDLIRNTLITISGEAGPAPGRPGASGVPGIPNVPPGDSSTIDHISSLQEGVRLVVSHPFGVGLGNVGSRVVPGDEQRPAYFAESWYLTMGLSLGWLGLLWAIIWTAALAGLAIQGIRSLDRPAVALALLGSVATVAIVGMLLPTLMEPQIAIFPWALAALAIQEMRDRRSMTEIAASADG